MYKRDCSFLHNKNITYALQFGFGQQNSTYHALINITKNIIKALQNGNLGCGTFVELQQYY